MLNCNCCADEHKELETSLKMFYWYHYNYYDCYAAIIPAARCVSVASLLATTVATYPNTSAGTVITQLNTVTTITQQVKVKYFRKFKASF